MKSLLRDFRMNILLIGPQASGKGTQAEKLVKKFGLAYVEMGHLLRKVAQEDSPLGFEVKKIIEKGQLVPDEIIFQVIENYLKRVGSFEGIVFDGFPRIISQAEYFQEFLAKKGKKIDLVIYLSLPREVTFSRLSNRRICEKCGAVFNLITKPPKKEKICDFCGGSLIVRADETPEKIKTRLEEFERETLPLIDFYKKKGILEEVDGNQPIEAVFKDILKRLRKRGLIS